MEVFEVPADDFQVAQYMQLELIDLPLEKKIDHEGEVIEFGHSLRAATEIREQRIDPRDSDQEMLMADQGKRILRQNTGNQLELTSGDCGF